MDSIGCPRYPGTIVFQVTLSDWGGLAAAYKVRATQGVLFITASNYIALLSTIDVCGLQKHFFLHLLLFCQSEAVFKPIYKVFSLVRN